MEQGESREVTSIIQAGEAGSGPPHKRANMLNVPNANMTQRRENGLYPLSVKNVAIKSPSVPWHHMSSM